MLTEAQLQKIMPNLTAAARGRYLAPLNDALAHHAVDTLLRTAAFIAQLAHESGELRWMEEIWGPTAAQKRYEPPGELARRLGNTQAGDGARFKGRGPIQITGRANYRTYGDLLGIDLVAEPERAAAPELAFETAGLFWQKNGLNELADAREFVAITRRINGGTNGLADRQMYYARAQAVLGIAGTRAGPPGEPLPRGFEAIAAVAKAARKKPAAKKPATRKPTARKRAPRKAAAKAAPTRHSF
jgi:putative chitinase